MYYITISKLGINVETSDVRDVFAYMIAHDVAMSDITFVE